MSNDLQDKSEVIKLPANVRVMIAIVASPTLAVFAFVLYSVFTGSVSDFSVSGVIFSALCIFAYYLVIAGRLPAWLNFKKSPKV